MNRVWRIWLIAMVAKTVVAIWLPFFNDESYYWVWGHHPALSYFDHPPVVGWLFWLGTFLESFGNAARLPGVWLGHATLLIWVQILKPYLNEKHLARWLLFALLSPLLGFGALIITPDVPLIFFWSLSIYLFVRALDDPSWKTYSALGISLGLGFCAKYMIVLFVPCAIAWIIWGRQARRIRWPLVPLIMLFGLLFCLPVIGWNATHDWASFRFQLNHGLASEKWDPTWPLEYLGGQLLLLFPLVVWCLFRRKEPVAARFLHCFGWLPLAFFFYTSFKAHVEANWPIMAHPSLLALAFINAPDSRAIRNTMIVWSAAALLILSEIAHHWVPIEPSHLKTYEFTHYDVLIPLAQQRAPFYLGSYQEAAAVSYRLRQQFYKLDGLNRRDVYDFLPQSKAKDDSFWLGCETYQPLPDWALKAGYYEASSYPLSSEFRIVEVKRSAQGADR